MLSLLSYFQFFKCSLGYLWCRVWEDCYCFSFTVYIHANKMNHCIPNITILTRVSLEKFLSSKESKFSLINFHLKCFALCSIPLHPRNNEWWAQGGLDASGTSMTVCRRVLVKSSWAERILRARSIQILVNGSPDQIFDFHCSYFFTCEPTEMWRKVQ